MIVLRQDQGQPTIILQSMNGAVARILGDAFADIDPWARYPFPASALEAYLATVEPGAPRYTIRVGGALAGAVGVREVWLRGPYMQFLGILPSFQRLGIGKLILEWVEAAAQQRDDRNLWVAASDFNADAIRFYERFGFSRVASLEDLVRDGKTELLLRKRL
jgi:diamine N-acetyltransferase